MSYFRFPIICCSKQKKKIRKCPEDELNLFDTNTKFTQEKKPRISHSHSQSQSQNSNTLPVLNNASVRNKSIRVQVRSSLIDFSAISSISKVSISHNSTAHLINDISLIEKNTNKIKIYPGTSKKRNIRMFNNYINSRLEKFKEIEKNPNYASMKLAQV